MLTGSDDVFPTVDESSVVKGDTVHFGISTGNPAAQGYNVNVEVTASSPAGSIHTPAVDSIWVAANETSAQFPVVIPAELIPERDYTLTFRITHFNGQPISQPPSVSVDVIDDDGDAGDGSGAAGSATDDNNDFASFANGEGSTSGGGGGSSGGGGGSPGPTSVTLNQPADAYEGTPFQLTGTISPAGYYSFEYSVTGNYGNFQYDPQTGNFSVFVLVDDDGPHPGNGMPSDIHPLTMSVWPSGSPGSAVSDVVDAAVHNVAPEFTDHSGQLRIDVSDYPLGGPTFNVIGTLMDDGVYDRQDVTIDWGDGSLPTLLENDPLGQQFMASHTYLADGEDYTVTVTAEDDDGGIVTYVETIGMYLLDLDNDANNNGEINGIDDPIEHIPPGAYVGVNARVGALIFECAAIRT